MKKRLVRESISETWVSSDTGIERYFPRDSNISTPVYHEEMSNDNISQRDMLNNSEISEMIPPPTIKLTAEDFKHYIDGLINNILPVDPLLALNVFTAVIQTHPYLTKRLIGFKGGNPYEPVIQKFLISLKERQQKLQRR